MDKRLIPLTLIILVFFSSLVQAAELSLKDAIDMAFLSNPRIIEARAGIEEMAAMSGQLDSSMGWRLDGNLNGYQEKTPITMKLPYEVAGQDPPENYGVAVSSLVVSKGLFWTPENASKREQAQLGIQVAVEQLRMAQKDLLMDVVKAYYDVWRAYEGVQLSKAAKDDAERALEIAVEKVRDGSGTERDVIAARSWLLQMESNLQYVERSMDLALRYLGSLIGKKPLSIEDILPPRIDVSMFAVQASPWYWGVDDMVSLALKYRPEMNLSKLGVAVAWRDVDVAQAGRRPNYKLSGSYLWGEEGARVESSIGSDGRFMTVLSKIDNTLPDIEDIEISDEDWEDWLDIWDELWDGEPPTWTPTKRQTEKLLSRGSSMATPEDEWKLNLDVTFNIFDSHLVKKGVERAEKKVEQAESKVELAAQMIELEVLQRYTQLLEGHKGVKVAQIKLEEAQEQHAQAMGLKARGLLTHQDEMSLGLLILQKESELSWALYDYEIAKARLGVALGMDLEWLIGSLNF